MGVLQDNRLEKVQGIFKPQNECFAIKDLQMDLLGLYVEGFFFKKPLSFIMLNRQMCKSLLYNDI